MERRSRPFADDHGNALRALVIAVVAIAVIGGVGYALFHKSAGGDKKAGPTTSTAATTTASFPASPNPPLAIGDSVMLGAYDALGRAIPGVVVDAAVSKQFSGGSAGNPSITSIVQAKAAAGKLGDVVIIHGGTNGRFTSGDLAMVMSSLKTVHRVVLINDHEPRAWAPPNNAVLAGDIHKYSNAVLVDWNKLGDAHPKWFVSDGIHLTDAGQDAYAAAIKKAINARAESTVG
jgi:lysophospholipase L1-like esterase